MLRKYKDPSMTHIVSDLRHSKLGLHRVLHGPGLLLPAFFFFFWISVQFIFLLGLAKRWHGFIWVVLSIKCGSLNALNARFII